MKKRTNEITSATEVKRSKAGSIEMKSWTGFTGVKDKEIRKNGKTYIIILVDDELRIGTEKQLELVAWDEWCNVCARTKKEALQNYDNAFLQWQHYNNTRWDKMKMGFKRAVEYIIDNLETDGQYDVFYDADKGEWIIKPVEWDKMNYFDKEDQKLEEARDRDHKKKKYPIPDKIEIFSVNDMW